MTLLKPRFWVHSVHTSSCMPSYQSVPSSATQTPWPRFKTTINYELQSSVLQSSLLLMKYNSPITENIFNIFLTSFLTWKCQISMSLDCLVLGYFILNNDVWVFAWILFYFFKKFNEFWLGNLLPWISNNFWNDSIHIFIFLHCIFVWSRVLSISNYKSKYLINFEKCWRCFTSCSIKHSANLILF